MDPDKGIFEVVLSNSVSTGSCDIVVYWGYGQMDPVGSILLMLKPWMDYDYIVIQVICWVELPKQVVWIPINGTHQCGIGSTEIHRNSVG